MPRLDEAQFDLRVLLLPATRKDGDVTRSLLQGAGLDCMRCADLRELTAQVQRGVGAVLMTEDVIATPGMAELLRVFESQPPWSEIPVVILMQGAGGSPGAARVLGALRNVTMLERPAPMRSVVSALQAAIRGRKRQYELRDQMETIRAAEARARELQDQLEKLLESEKGARLDAEQANRMKDEFLATLSHELRTPLSAILGWSQLLMRGGGDDKAMLQEGLSVIDRNARVQTQLIEDLLDMSRIISGKIRLDINAADPAAFIEAAVETVKPAAEAKGIVIRKLLDREASPIMGDSGRLQQVVWNLLSNSIKFTPREGSVEVLLRRVGSHVEISVSDTGQGIAPQFLPHVFERFRQADPSTTRKHGGLGLGLAIVKQLVELHGGTVAATSPGEGCGSTFSVRLPLAVVRHTDNGRDHPQPEPLEELPCATLEGLTVMVVDDEPDARHLLRRVMEDCGAEVITAGSAAEALPLIESHRPDVLVSDIGMPLMDGYEFLRQVRALGPDRGGAVPAIALTAFARSQDRTRALLAGFIVHVAKPVEPQELLATVASVGGLTGGKIKA